MLPHNFIDITGKKFGRLTPVERAENGEKGQTRWVCRCDCGKMTTVQYSNLRSGCIKSCGCLNRENTIKRNTKHGCAPRGNEERLHTVWRGMVGRCYAPNHASFKYYGALGVKVCEEWKNDYSIFREWAISNGYENAAKRGKCTIDRIDPFGDYTPSNCRFVDMKTQNNNKRRDKA